MADQQDGGFAQFQAPGTTPKVMNIFDFSAEALGQLKSWLEMSGFAVPVGQLVGFTQQQSIRGRVSSAGAIVSGTGFTVSKLGTGNYQITFSSSLPSVPAINATIDNNSVNLACKVANATVSLFQVLTYDMAGTATDSGFYFTASPFV